MPQLLTLSRAARLVGVTRGALQKRIRDNELETFEGKVRVSDLLRVFPEVRLEDDTGIERAHRIMAAAGPRRDQESELPPPEVLASRLTSLSRLLTETKTELGHHSELLTALAEKLKALEFCEDHALRQQLRALTEWFDHELEHRPKIPKRKAELLAKDTFLRVIAAQVKVIPSGHDFFVEGTDSILEAALRAGLALRYGCSSGTCGSCKARVVTGEVLKVRDHEYQISDTEHSLGYILMCSYTAVTDLTIEAAEAQGSEDIPPQSIPARVKQVTRPNDQLAVVHVQTPKTQRLRFLAGQNATLSLVDGSSAELPLASCPCDGQNLEFHFRRHAPSPFADAVLSGVVQSGSPLTITGPHGSFVLEEDAPNPILFIVYDDGFAPIKSLIESAISSDNAEAYHLYWVVPEEGGHYMDNRCRSWTDALDNFEYTPMVVPIEHDYGGLTRVLEGRVAELDEIGRYMVYAAGPPEFLEVVEEVMVRHGLGSAQLHMKPIP